MDPSAPMRKLMNGIIVATFVLIHAAADVGWYWHLVEAMLRHPVRE
jgi:hypothetical protein